MVGVTDNLRRGVDVDASTSAAAGAFSGMVARMVTAPLDIVKIRLQLQDRPAKGQQALPVKYKGILNTIVTIAKEEGGVRSLWKGNVPAEIMYILYGATQFTAYSTFNTALTSFENAHSLQVPSSFHSLMIGSLSGTVGTAISYPFDVMRTRFAFNRSKKFLSFFGTISYIARTEGIRGFFGGISPSLLAMAVSSGSTFCAYEFLSEATDKHAELSFLSPFCGLIAGTFSKTVVFPLDLIRKRMQLTNNDAKMTSLIRAVYTREGVLGFYHGLSPALIKSAPTTAVSIWMYQLAVATIQNTGFQA
ncbi:unnamed protein product [Kuraishia capsulata CBS 1993]|uniref:Mitochondrial thiamine pyrophosphate carrier 1 n=1 Tax=Kuraishia capsulata CBS 1993 TaxID=1382522 RepID=W6MI02_9ASCO|nr:uncharacterized protein KUCA_T00001671001 [Kuraishia capsulata CBS 1993]CDK25701.1 unnamed protein product [Kuraishia capsulata CBS 1993]